MRPGEGRTGPKTSQNHQKSQSNKKPNKNRNQKNWNQQMSKNVPKINEIPRAIAVAWPWPWPHGNGHGPSSWPCTIIIIMAMAMLMAIFSALANSFLEILKTLQSLHLRNRHDIRFGATDTIGKCGVNVQHFQAQADTGEPLFTPVHTCENLCTPVSMRPAHLCTPMNT